MPENNKILMKKFEINKIYLAESSLSCLFLSLQITITAEITIACKVVKVKMWRHRIELPQRSM